MPNGFEETDSEERQEWEPSEAYQWVEVDPLQKALRDVEIETTDNSGEALSFHSAWRRYPAPLRAQVMREREIAAVMVRFIPGWRLMIPGFVSAGVSMRAVPEPQLAAVVTAETPLTSGEWFDIRSEWSRANLKSMVPAYSDFSGSIPIELDVRPAPTLLGQVPADSFLLGDPEPAPQGAPVLQSGDKVGSESPSGIREYGTLSCLVSEPGLTTPLVLGSGHVMRQAGYNLVSSRANPVTVGKVRRVHADCDAAVAELQSPYLCDYRLRAADLVPAAPVIATSDLPVQMYGASSGYQTGYLNQVNVIPANATKVGMFPMFSADIRCAHGDSGALLVTGRGAEPPVSASQKRYMSAQYLESMTCAMLGILKAGPPAGADPMLRPQGYFTPILRVLNDLAVEAWVR